MKFNRFSYPDEHPFKLVDLSKFLLKNETANIEDGKSESSDQTDDGLSSDSETTPPDKGLEDNSWNRNILKRPSTSQT